jgi:hypothetical protein
MTVPEVRGVRPSSPPNPASSFAAWAGVARAKKEQLLELAQTPPLSIRMWVLMEAHV